MHPGLAIIVLWVGWAVSSAAAALWSNRTEKSVGLHKEAGYRVVLIPDWPGAGARRETE
jgi:hypothetical protein